MWSELAEDFLREAEQLQEAGNSSVIVALSGIQVSPYGRKQELNLDSFADSIIKVRYPSIFVKIVLPIFYTRFFLNFSLNRNVKWENNFEPMLSKKKL